MQAPIIDITESLKIASFQLSAIVLGTGRQFRTCLYQSTYYLQSTDSTLRIQHHNKKFPVIRNDSKGAAAANWPTRISICL